MKTEILIAMGSPRKKGNASTLAAKLSDGAQAAGATVETLYLNGMNIRPCQSCYKCQEEDTSSSTNRITLQDSIDVSYYNHVPVANLDIVSVGIVICVFL